MQLNLSKSVFIIFLAQYFGLIMTVARFSMSYNHWYVFDDSVKLNSGNGKTVHDLALCGDIHADCSFIKAKFQEKWFCSSLFLHTTSLCQDIFPADVLKEHLFKAFVHAQAAFNRTLWMTLLALCLAIPTLFAYQLRRINVVCCTLYFIFAETIRTLVLLVLAEGILQYYHVTFYTNQFKEKYMSQNRTTVHVNKIYTGESYYIAMYLQATGLCVIAIALFVAKYVETFDESEEIRQNKRDVETQTEEQVRTAEQPIIVRTDSEVDATNLF